MRIGIDARFFGVKNKGLGRYTQKLIENLENIQEENSNNEYFVFLREENFNEYESKNKNFHKVLADYKWYSFSEQFKLPRVLNKYNLDLVHFPHFNVPIFYRKTFILTIHDLILLHFPTIKNTTLSPVFYWIKFLAYKMVIGSAVRRARKIVAVSNFTKDDVASNYGSAGDKIEVIYEACDDIPAGEGEIDSGALLKRHGIIKPYILYVGNAYPHKNLDNLVLAFKEISNPKMQLVLVGKIDHFYRKTKELVEENKIKDVIFTDFITDNELDVIYENSEAYIFPSLYEGFGLPPLEAMRRGVPVASSDHGCMREILGDAALYFDASDKNNIRMAIEKIAVDENLKRDLRNKGFKQIEKYNWKEMAEETLKIYESSR